MPPTNHTPDPETPPVLGSWPNTYAFVLIVHVLLLVAFYLFSQAYAA